jgi:hypothetical protein
VTVNLLLEEFCNIGTLGMDYLKQLAILRGFNIFCHHLVQSIPQLTNRYPRDQWEEIISHCDCMVCLGANDLKTAAYFSDKCGKVTIRVDNNQMPLMPLFSPIYSSTRPYSQTRSNTQRPLMMPDEVLRMENEKELVLLRGQKPLLLDKITPEEFPLQNMLTYTKISDYSPSWRATDARPEAPAVSEPLPSIPNDVDTSQQITMQIDEPEDVLHSTSDFEDATPDTLPAVEQPVSGRPAWLPAYEYLSVPPAKHGNRVDDSDDDDAPGLRQYSGNKEMTLKSLKDESAKI